MSTTARVESPHDGDVPPRLPRSWSGSSSGRWPRVGPAGRSAEGAGCGPVAAPGGDGRASPGLAPAQPGPRRGEGPGKLVPFSRNERTLRGAVRPGDWTSLSPSRRRLLLLFPLSLLPEDEPRASSLSPGGEAPRVTGSIWAETGSAAGPAPAQRPVRGGRSLSVCPSVCLSSPPSTSPHVRIHKTKIPEAPSLRTVSAWYP